MARIDYTETGQSGLVAFNGLVSEGYTSKLEWPSAYAIYDEMRRRDPTIRTMWNALILLARTASWYFEPAGDADWDKRAAEYLQGCIEDMSHPIEDYIEDALTCVLFGWSWLELVYKRRDDGQVGWRKWAMRRQSSFERWKFDKTGGIQGMVQRPAPDYEEIPIPIGKSLHFTSQRDGGNPEGLAILETAYEPWYFLKNLQIIQGIGWQRTFVGLPVFEFTTKPSSDDLAAVEKVGQALTVDQKQFVSVPETVKFELASAQNSGAESLLNTIKYYRLLILQMLLADFINLGVGTTGSWALGSDKSQLFLMAVDGFLDRHATVVNRFGVPRLLEALPPYGEATYNGGKAKLVHTPVEKPALAQLGSWLQQVSSLLHWSEEDETWIRKRTGMPALTRISGQDGSEEEGTRIPGQSGSEEEETEGEGDGEGAEIPEMAEYLANMVEFSGRDVERKKVEAALERRIRTFLREQAQRVVARAQYGSNPGEDKDFWKRELDALKQSFLGELHKHINNVTSMAIEDVREILGAGTDWTTVNADAADWARKQVGKLIKGITSTTRDSVRKHVSTWIDTGAALPDLEKALAPIFGKKRAQLIAATEVTRAYDEANDMVRQESGLPATRFKAPAHPGCRCYTRPLILPNGEWVVVWSTVRDSRVCKRPIGTPWGRVNGCAALHKVIVSEGPYFGQEFSKVKDRLEGGPGAAGARPSRPQSAQEKQAEEELAEAREAYQAMQKAGDEYAAQGVKEYIDTLESTLEEEREINDALYERFRISPDAATSEDWELLADSLDQEGYDLYRKYTKEGIERLVAEKRGAQASGYRSVGSEVIEIRQGRFSRRRAQTMQGELWGEAKEELRNAIGDLLEDVGYSEADISRADYHQRLRLLEELGQKELMRTSRGIPSKIDKVPATVRERIVEGVDFDIAATCANAAMDPLALPTLDAYGKMEMADMIRAIRVR